MLTWNESAWFAMFVGVALKSTAVLAASWLATVLLRSQPAALRHLIWTAAAAAVLALPFLSISLPVLSLPVAGALATDVSVVFHSTTTADAGSDAARSRPVEVSKPLPPYAPPRSGWRLYAMLAWAAGSLVGLIQMLFAYAAMWRMRRAAAPSPDRGLADELAQSFGIGQPVETLETEEGAMPMTFGILRPAVLLPAEARHWTEERRRIVLLHELAHVRRFDTATQLIARLALISNWWNPLARKAWREFLKERERAADDMVLDSGARASDYARHLLDVAAAMRSAPAWGAAVAMARRSQLEGRLTAILDTRVNRKTISHAWTLAAALAGVALVAPVAAVRAQETAPAAVPADVDATIRTALAQKNHEMLEKPAEAFEALKEYDAAQKLLESAVMIRQEVSGSQSLEYGLGLVKIADLEGKRRRPKEADAFYTKALSVLGERPEAVPALLHLGLHKMKDSPDQAIEYFEKAQRLDAAHAGPAMMWIALTREREHNATAAEALYISALAVENPESHEAVNTMQLYARFLKDQGRADEAKAMQERASAVLKTFWQTKTEQPAAEVLKVGKGVTAPSVLFKTEPEYTEEARAGKYSGTVVLYIEIGPEGTAHNVRVVKGIGMGLDEKAVEAVSKWRFRPGTKDGAPVTVAAHIEVNFRLL